MRPARVTFTHRGHSVVKLGCAQNAVGPRTRVEGFKPVADVRDNVAFSPARVVGRPPERAVEVSERREFDDEVADQVRVGGRVDVGWTAAVHDEGVNSVLCICGLGRHHDLDLLSRRKYCHG